MTARLTPAGRPLRAPTRALAEALEAEAAGEPAAAVMTRLAYTALDVPRATTLARARARALDDALRVRPPSGAALAEDAARAGEPALAWARTRGLALAITTTLTPAPLAPAACARLDAWLEGFDAFTLAGVAAAASAGGSCVVALALAEGALGAEGACAAAFWEERGALRLWGEDAPARAALRAREGDLRDAARFLALCQAATGPNTARPA